MAELDPTQIKITEQQKNCLLFIQQEYLVDGAIPTAARISDTFGVTPQTAKRWLDSPEFEYLLGRVGIAKPDVVGVLSARQLTLVNMLFNLGDRRSEREKCEAAGVKPQELSAWRRDSTFNKYMQDRAQALFDDSGDVAYMAILKQMKGGDMKATQLYLEMTGKYQPSVRHDVNIDGFLLGLVEILQRRIPDRQLLEVIAGDIENLRLGKAIDFDSAPAIIEVQATPTLQLPGWGGKCVNCDCNSHIEGSGCCEHA